MNINGKLFLWVLDIVRASDIADRLGAVLRPDEAAGGRPRRFGLYVWLTAFIVATMTGSGAFEVRAHRVLTQDLPRSLQVQLGVRRRAVGPRQSHWSDHHPADPGPARPPRRPPGPVREGSV